MLWIEGTNYDKWKEYKYSPLPRDSDVRVGGRDIVIAIELLF
jgi:hypothetical protein